MAVEYSYPKLLSLVAHELRTPASVVSGYLGMLERDTESPLTDRQRKLVEAANKSCARLVTLIAEMSDVSKLDDRQLPLMPQPLDLFVLVGEVAATIHEGEDRDVRLELRGHTDGAAISGDLGRLRASVGAIFRALLRERPGPCVLVADRRVVRSEDGNSAVVVIADNNNVHTVYDAAPAPFDETRAGLGLSLPIARRVIEAHGGRLWSPTPGDDGRALGAALIAFPLGG